MGLGASGVSVFAASSHSYRSRRRCGFSLVSASCTGVRRDVWKVLSSSVASSGSFPSGLQVLVAGAGFPFVRSSSALLILPVTGFLIRWSCPRWRTQQGLLGPHHLAQQTMLIRTVRWRRTHWAGEEGLWVELGRPSANRALTFLFCAVVAVAVGRTEVPCLSLRRGLGARAALYSVPLTTRLAIVPGLSNRAVIPGFLSPLPPLLPPSLSLLPFPLPLSDRKSVV